MTPTAPIPPWPERPTQDELGYWTFSGSVTPYVYQSITGERESVFAAYNRALIAAYRARLKLAVEALQEVIDNATVHTEYEAKVAAEALAAIGPAPNIAHAGGVVRVIRKCPLCDWAMEEPPLPTDVNAGTLADFFGPRVMLHAAWTAHARAVERELEAHFATHPTVDWVKGVVARDTTITRLHVLRGAAAALFAHEDSAARQAEPQSWAAVIEFKRLMDALRAALKAADLSPKI